eukprot:scaffold17780_cov71-Phaeocystis_antarctica.AAC.5
MRGSCGAARRSCARRAYRAATPLVRSVVRPSKHVRLKTASRRTRTTQRTTASTRTSARHTSTRARTTPRLAIIPHTRPTQRLTIIPSRRRLTPPAETTPPAQITPRSPPSIARRLPNPASRVRTPKRNSEHNGVAPRASRVRAAAGPSPRRWALWRPPLPSLVRLARGRAPRCAVTGVRAGAACRDTRGRLRNIHFQTCPEGQVREMARASSLTAPLPRPHAPRRTPARRSRQQHGLWPARQDYQGKAG